MQLGAFRARENASCCSSPFSSPSAPMESMPNPMVVRPAGSWNLSYGEAIVGPRKPMRLDAHEGIGEQVTDTGFLQPRDRGGCVVRPAYVVAVIDDGGRAVGQHFEAADIGGIEVVFGREAAAQRQELRIVGARPQVGYVSTQHRLPQARVGIDDARQRDHAGAVDRFGVCRLERWSDGTDLAILDQDVGLRKITQSCVHRDDLGASDDNSLWHHWPL